MDDSKIVELFYERSEQAIIELSKKYGSICTRVANNILNNRLDAEECVNDAYLGAWNTIPPQKPNPLLSYVCHYWHADSIVDLAELFHTSSHNVSVRLSRTREKLRKYLIKEGVSL